MDFIYSGEFEKKKLISSMMTEDRNKYHVLLFYYAMFNNVN